MAVAGLPGNAEVGGSCDRSRFPCVSLANRLKKKQLAGELVVGAETTNCLLKFAHSAVTKPLLFTVITIG